MCRTTLIIFLVSLLLLTASSCSQPKTGSAGQPEWWELDEVERYESIRNEFTSYAATQGYRFESGTQSMLDQLIVDSVTDAVMRNKPENMQDERRQISENIRILVDRMILEAQADRKHSLKHPGVIGEMALSRALSFICPLWPFCE